MIPSDLAARLRQLTEASFFDADPAVPAINRVRDIQAQLPDLLPGHRFIATLQRPLPDGTFKAIVAGRELTLALSQSAKTGDTLELVVTQTTPRVLFAELAPQTTGHAALTQPTLSSAGKLISFLLTGQPSTPAAQLAGGQPLLASPPSAGQAAQALAPVLRQALSQSGLFYESHQQQWLSGKVLTAELLREPQGQISPNLQLVPNLTNPAAGSPPGGQGLASTLANLVFGTQPGASSEGSSSTSSALRDPGTGSHSSAATNTNARALASAEAGAASAQESDAQARLESNAARQPLIPERLVQVVHQQLDALASQTYMVHGQAWPGLNFQLEIEDQEDTREDGGNETPDWNTTLRVSLPRLGGVEARVQLSHLGLALRLIADTPDTAAAFAAARDELDSALSAVDLPLIGFAVEVRDDDGQDS